MLYPIPGLTHLKYLVPEPLPVPGTPKAPIPREVSALIRVALDSVFGLRPVSQLHPKRFDASVRTHVVARQKAGPVGVVKLLSCHVQMGEGAAEAFGSVVLGVRTTAYAAQLRESDGIWRMRSFRVLG